MSVETYIDQAQRRVQAEQEAVDAKIEAIETFKTRIRDIPTESALSSSNATTQAGIRFKQTSSSTDQCRTVRNVFSQTIQPHSIADLGESEQLLDTIRNEFSEPIAVALAPTTETSFTPKLKQMIIAEANAQQNGAEILSQTLEQEADHLAEACKTVDGIIEWIIEVNETPLTKLDFDALTRRHERLEAHRNQCEQLIHRRQELLQQTMTKELTIGMDYSGLLPYLYQDFPVEHPVLSTGVKLIETCDECQRAIRAHLIRKG